VRRCSVVDLWVVDAYASSPAPPCGISRTRYAPPSRTGRSSSTADAAGRAGRPSPRSGGYPFRRTTTRSPRRSITLRAAEVAGGCLETLSSRPCGQSSVRPIPVEEINAKAMLAVLHRSPAEVLEVRHHTVCSGPNRSPQGCCSFPRRRPFLSTVCRRSWRLRAVCAAPAVRPCSGEKQPGRQRRDVCPGRRCGS
jgi:hypothetical protein